MDSLPLSDRRGQDRWDDYEGEVVALAGRMAKLHDLSPTGAKVVCNSAFAQGSTVLLDLPWGKTVRATVVASNYGVTRLKFDFPIEQPY